VMIRATGMGIRRGNGKRDTDECHPKRQPAHERFLAANGRPIGARCLCDLSH
jgi:hypothetical protein